MVTGMLRRRAAPRESISAGASVAWVATAVLLLTSIGAVFGDVDPGKIGLKFYGNEYAKTGAPVETFPEEDFTITMRVKGQKGNILSYGVEGAGSFDGQHFALSDMDNLIISRGAGDPWVTNVGFGDGVWHALAVTWKKSTGVTKIYKDGVFMYEHEMSREVPITPGGIMVLGQLQRCPVGCFPEGTGLEGTIADMTLWSRELTAHQVEYLANNSPAGEEQDLVGFWPLNEKDGAVEARDESGVNFFYLGGPAVSTDVGMDQATHSVAFNKQDMVVLSPKKDLPAGDFTVEFWIKTNSGKDCNIFTYYMADNTEPLVIKNPLKIIVEHNGEAKSTDINVVDNQWNHVAIGWQKEEGYLFAYFNGGLVYPPAWLAVEDYPKLPPLDVGGVLPTRPDRIVLGARINKLEGSNFVDGSGFSGMLQELRVWDHVRSQEEIEQLKNFKLPSDPMPQGVVMYWSMDEPDSSLVLHDTAGPNDGVMTKPTWENTLVAPPFPTLDAVNEEVAALRGEMNDLLEYVKIVMDPSLNVTAQEAKVKEPAACDRRYSYLCKTEVRPIGVAPTEGEEGEEAEGEGEEEEQNAEQGETGRRNAGKATTTSSSAATFTSSRSAHAQRAAKKASAASSASLLVQQARTSHTAALNPSEHQELLQPTHRHRSSSKSFSIPANKNMKGHIAEVASSSTTGAAVNGVRALHPQATQGGGSSGGHNARPATAAAHQSSLSTTTLRSDKMSTELLQTGETTGLVTAEVDPEEVERVSALPVEAAAPGGAGRRGRHAWATGRPIDASATHGTHAASSGFGHHTHAWKAGRQTGGPVASLRRDVVGASTGDDAGASVEFVEEDETTSSPADDDEVADEKELESDSFEAEEAVATHADADDALVASDTIPQEEADVDDSGPEARVRAKGKLAVALDVGGPAAVAAASVKVAPLTVTKAPGSGSAGHGAWGAESFEQLRGSLDEADEAGDADGGRPSPSAVPLNGADAEWVEAAGVAAGVAGDRPVPPMVADDALLQMGEGTGVATRDDGGHAASGSDASEGDHHHHHHQHHHHHHRRTRSHFDEAAAEVAAAGSRTAGANAARGGAAGGAEEVPMTADGGSSVAVERSELVKSGQLRQSEHAKQENAAGGVVLGSDKSDEKRRQQQHAVDVDEGGVGGAFEQVLMPGSETEWDEAIAEGVSNSDLADDNVQTDDISVS